mmetsp:Transcript_43435/g.78041  ORF Transcript_43435/g.78041 Transcript_43435/m.78041 type:complete len:262 (-) Transcript_43435:834-1619(-)
MDHQFSSPIYRSNMVSESHFFAHEEDECDAKIASASTRSPTTVFAVDELSSVFRVPDDAIERGSVFDNQEREAGSNWRRRCLTPSSFTTDGELSTFSEDTEEGNEETSDDGNDHQSPFTGYSRRRSPLSIFRPVSGTKRRYDFQEREHHANTTPTKRRACSAQLLCHANPIGSDDVCDEIPLLSSSYSFASPLKRVCRSSSSSTSSSLTSLFAEALPATIRSNQADAFSVTPQLLQHPLSFEALPILRATNIIKTDDIKEN